MGRIITVLLIGLAPLIILGIRACAATLPSLAPPPPPAELMLPADQTVDPPPEPPAEEPTPAPAPAPEAPDEPSA